MEERLQKILSRVGAASRRGAEKMIKAGRVKVNGIVVDRLGAKADPSTDLIELDGHPIGEAEKLSYFMFNKPAGFITTMNDPQGRAAVTELIDHIGIRVFPVGRLDRDTEGLLILTNDGELAQKLMHPKFHVPKTYRVKVKGVPGPRELKRLAMGEILLGERKAAPADVDLIKIGKDRSWLKLTIIEGRNRQVKRMCSAVGHPVLKLKRIAYGPLTLGRLGSGEIRPLEAVEVKKLKKAASQPNPPVGNAT